MSIPAGFFIPIRYRAVDANGNPYASAVLYFYASGTSTPLTVYSDYQRSVALGTSVAADAGGLFPAIYLPASTYKVQLKTAGGVLIWDADNVPNMDYLAAQAIAILAPTAAQICQGRLTLTAGTPVTTADVTAATAVRWTPYKGNAVALYDGAAWQVVTFSELSLSLGTDAANTNYDLFAYLSSGVAALERVAWTNDTTRATALALQDGVLVKSGATTRRYLGTYRTTGTVGQTEDSFLKRLVWNYYHQERRPLRAVDVTDSWSYTTATVRQARATVTNQVEVVIGVADVLIELDVRSSASNTNSGVTLHVGIGEDATNAYVSGLLWSYMATQSAGGITQGGASLKKFPTVGYHFYAWLEWSSATGTTTWYGDNGAGATGVQSGMVGSVNG